MILKQINSSVNSFNFSTSPQAINMIFYLSGLIFTSLWLLGCRTLLQSIEQKKPNSGDFLSPKQFCHCQIFFFCFHIPDRFSMCLTWTQFGGILMYSNIQCVLTMALYTMYSCSKDILKLCLRFTCHLFFSFFNSLGTMNLTFRFSSLIPQMQTKPLEIWLCLSVRYDFLIFKLFCGIIDKQINNYWLNILYLVKIQNKIKVQMKRKDVEKPCSVFQLAIGFNAGATLLCIYMYMYFLLMWCFQCFHYKLSYLFPSPPSGNLQYALHWSGWRELHYTAREHCQSSLIIYSLDV